MRNLKIFTSSMLLIICIGSFTACKKDNYLTDGGIHDVNTPLSTYDYLKGNQNHLFDTTILLIDHFNLKEDINKAGTFFAFTNYSISLLMTQQEIKSLDQLYDSLSSNFFKQYMFSAKDVNLDKATLIAVPYNNLAGDKALCAIKKIPGTYAIYLNNSAPVFNFYTLQYVKINGVIDGSPNPPPGGDLTDAVISCQTSGIITSTGTTLHVLNNNAPLNKL